MYSITLNLLKLFKKKLFQIHTIYETITVAKKELANDCTI